MHFAKLKEMAEYIPFYEQMLQFRISWSYLKSQNPLQYVYYSLARHSAIGFLSAVDVIGYFECKTVLNILYNSWNFGSLINHKLYYLITYLILL